MKKFQDPKCRELADYFLPTTANELWKERLAQEIQVAVDDWFLAHGKDVQNEIEDAAIELEDP